jgi:hypothetical protein
VGLTPSNIPVNTPDPRAVRDRRTRREPEPPVTDPPPRSSVRLPHRAVSRWSWGSRLARGSPHERRCPARSQAPVGGARRHPRARRPERSVHPPALHRTLRRHRCGSRIRPAQHRCARTRCDPVRVGGPRPRRSGPRALVPDRRVHPSPRPGARRRRCHPSPSSADRKSRSAPTTAGARHGPAGRRQCLCIPVAAATGDRTLKAPRDRREGRNGEGRRRLG